MHSLFFFQSKSYSSTSILSLEFSRYLFSSLSFTPLLTPPHPHHTFINFQRTLHSSYSSSLSQIFHSSKWFPYTLSLSPFPSLLSQIFLCFNSLSFSLARIISSSNNSVFCLYLHGTPPSPKIWVILNQIPILFLSPFLLFSLFPYSLFQKISSFKVQIKE